MIRLVLVGKGDLLEKLLWCKKYSGLKTEEERIKSASFETGFCWELMEQVSDPALDSHKLLPKLKTLGLNLPNIDMITLIKGKILKQTSLFSLFTQFERIPGKPDFEYGLGYNLETFNVFFESAVHEEFEHVEVKKKMGGFVKEKVVTKEKKLKTATSLFGAAIATDDMLIAAVGREKDNRDNMRYGIRIAQNTVIVGNKRIPDKLDKKWKDQQDFFAQLCSELKKVETIINKLFTLVGYDEIPTMDLLVGEVAISRNIDSFSKEEIDGQIVVDTQYE